MHCLISPWQKRKTLLNERKKSKEICTQNKTERTRKDMKTYLKAFLGFTKQLCERRTFNTVIHNLFQQIVSMACYFLQFFSLDVVPHKKSLELDDNTRQRKKNTSIHDEADDDDDDDDERKTKNAFTEYQNQRRRHTKKIFWREFWESSNNDNKQRHATSTKHCIRTSRARRRSGKTTTTTKKSDRIQSKFVHPFAAIVSHCNTTWLPSIKKM